MHPPDPRFSLLSVATLELAAGRVAVRFDLDGGALVIVVAPFDGERDAVGSARLRVHVRRGGGSSRVVFSRVPARRSHS